MRPDLLIDQLAELAGQRNQDALDACFLDLFQDLLEPRSVAICRIAGERPAPHWSLQRRARRDNGDVVHEDAQRLPLAALPLHLEAWHSGEICQQEGALPTTAIPMGSHVATDCVIEVQTAQPLGTAELRLLNGVQRFHRHLRALVDENERDSLTRLLNRRSFDGSFGSMALSPAGADVEGAGFDGDRRRGTLHRRCWLAVMDIDHFKRVNDEHGHLIGDEALILVAQLLRAAFRGSDRLYRFGGEEFVVLLHAPGAAAAAVAFERLRRSVEDYAFPRVGRLTVSIGFTEVRPEDSPTSAFERADQAVYHAKSNGRNQIACHEELAGERPAPERTTALLWA